MLEALVRGMGWEASEMEIDCQFHCSSSSDDADTRMELDSNSASGELIPGLPEDLALECLLRVSYKCHPFLRKVCRRWEKEVTDPVFYLERRKAGTTRHCVCMLQALSAAEAAAQAAPGEKKFEEEEQKEAAAAIASSATATTNTVYGISMYDLEQRTWEWLPMIPEFANEGFPFFCRLVSLNGKLVVMGGWHPATWEALRSTYVFEFSTRQWRRGADMPRVRSFFACGVIGDSVFVAGGHDDDKTALATADVYSLDGDRWTLLPDMSEERDECSGAVLDEKFFVIGGYGTNAQGQFGSSADVFDPLTENWSRRNDMCRTDVQQQDGYGGTLSNAGYAVARGELYTIHRHSLLRYSPVKNVWTPVDTVPEASRLSPCASTSVNNDKLFVVASVTTAGCCGTTATNKSATECRGLSYIPETGSNGCRGLWQTIELNRDFSGLPQTLCTVEI